MYSILCLRNPIVVLLLFLIISLGAEEKLEVNYKERVLLEDFESKIFNSDSFQIQANTDYLPDVRMSKNLTSPDLISNTSLFVRIPTSGSGIPIDLIFSKPYRIEDYLIEIEFHIYSNQANGDLFLYLQDSKFQKHKILITSLNYNGWKSFKVPIGNKVFQSDYIIGKASSIKLTGIQFNVAKKETKDKDDFIAIDDIFIVKRSKYRFSEIGLD